MRDTQLERVQPLFISVKFLGIKLDDRLSFKDHVLEVSKKCPDLLALSTAV